MIRVINSIYLHFYILNIILIVILYNRLYKYYNNIVVKLFVNNLSL